MRVTIALLMTLIVISCSSKPICTLDPSATVHDKKVNPKATINCSF